MPDGIWGLQATVANELPNLNAGGTLSVLDEIAMAVMERGIDPSAVPTLLVVAGMRYANHLGISVQDDAADVIKEMKKWPQ